MMVQRRAYTERSNIHDFVTPINGNAEHTEGDRVGSGEIQIKQDPYNMGNEQGTGHQQGNEQQIEPERQMSTESTSEPKSKESSLDKQFEGNHEMHSEMMIDDLVPDFDLHGMFDDEGGAHDLSGNMSSPFLQ